MADNGWSPLDVVGSPIFNILDTASNIPGLDQTGLNEWLWSSPVTEGVRNFQDESPGGAFAADVAGMFVPYVGWASALNKAKMGATALGAVNRASRAAASLAPRSPIAAFALGETVRYAPLSAAQTGFDLAGGNFESPVDALTSFGAGTLLGAGFQAGGHALSPLVSRYAPTMIGGAWRAVFEPGPELSALYGFSDNVRAAAQTTSRNPVAQEALRPTLAPQHQARLLADLEAEVIAGQHPDVDLTLVQNARAEVNRRLIDWYIDPADNPFKVPKGSGDTKDALFTLDHLLRDKPAAGGNRVRQRLTGTGATLTNPAMLQTTLELPQNWLAFTEFPGITQATFTSAAPLRRSVGLDGGAANWRTVERTTPSGRSQVWSLRREADSGQWIAVTELQPAPGQALRMSARSQYEKLKYSDPGEPGNWFLSFKTDRPGEFFEDIRADFDSPEPGVVGRLEDRIQRGQSDFLDKAMDFREHFLSTATIRAGHEARLAGNEAKITEEILAGPTFGKQIANLVETYAFTADQQLKNSPEAKGIENFFRALFDAAEGRKNTRLYGKASIPEGKSPITALFSNPDMDDELALATMARRMAQEDPEFLELVRKFDKRGAFDAASIEGTPAGKFLKVAKEANLEDLQIINKAIHALRKVGATDARPIPVRADHIGLSRRWDGDIAVPVYAGSNVETDIYIAGGNRAHAEQKAKAWIAAEEAEYAAKGKTAPNFRIGKHFVRGSKEDHPAFIKVASLQPGLLESRAGMRGFENEHEPYKHLDDLIAEMDDNMTQRWRYLASVIGDALSGGKLNRLMADDPHSFNILKTRIAQLKGQPGPLEQRLNNIVDSQFASVLGTKSVSRAAEGINELMFHLLHGVGNIATPLLNLTSVAQTQMPEAVNLLSHDLTRLKGLGYQFPAFGEDGLPTKGSHFVPDPLGLMWRGVRRATNPDEETMAVFQHLFNKKEMGAGLANEFVGQDRTVALRASEGVRGADDVGFWAKHYSSLLMSKTEQVSRTFAVGMALDVMATIEKQRGIKFTMDMKIANALKFVRRTNYGYFQADRPMMFTSPLGAVFGNQKTWMINYLLMQAEYAGLAAKGQFGPLLMSLGATTLLGGVFAIPLLGSGIDAVTETFADKDAREYIFEQMGEGGNAISFGLPALFGMSLNGNVSAPGSNLAHDTEFFFTIVALERAKLMGRAIGRAWDDQVTLGMNPLRDELFRKQFAQGFAPRSIYRTFEGLMDEQLRSAATGYPLINEFGWGARVMHSLGFRSTDIAVQYAAYESMLKDRDSMRSKISLFGEAYATASLTNNREEMMRLLQLATIQGVDVNSVMRSAQVRMRAAGKDMFGRNFSGEQLERYNDMIRSGEEPN
jgi:hypothetical protein